MSERSLGLHAGPKILVSLSETQPGKTDGRLRVIRTNTNLQSSQHLRDTFFLLIDKEDVFQHDRSTFLTWVQNQPTGSKQYVLEYVVDFLVDTKIRSRETFKVTQNAVVV